MDISLKHFRKKKKALAWFELKRKELNLKFYKLSWFDERIVSFESNSFESNSIDGNCYDKDSYCYIVLNEYELY